VRTVEFQRTFDDLVAFHMFLRERLGLSRKQKWYGFAFIVVFFGGVATWHCYSCGRLVVLPVFQPTRVLATLSAWKYLFPGASWMSRLV